MRGFDNYVCDGQMSIFDFLDSPEDDKPLQQDVNEFWHEVPSVLPKNKDWKNALFVIYDKASDEIHYNIPGEVKDGTFRRPKDSPKGEVIAWRYCREVKNNDL